MNLNGRKIEMVTVDISDGEILEAAKRILVQNSKLTPSSYLDASSGVIADFDPRCGEAVTLITNPTAAEIDLAVALEQINRALKKSLATTVGTF